MKAMLALFLGCALLAGCGGGSTEPGRDGGLQPDGFTCQPLTCAARGWSCGTTSDGCGRTLACGSCAAGLTCGGAGDDNVCDAVTIAVDVKTIAVSGVVTANGVVPAQTCASPTDLRGEVIFSEEQGHATFRLPMHCAAADQPFVFSGVVYPGVYRVQVVGSAASSLPSTSLTVSSGLDLSVGRSDLEWDITSHAVSGTVTQNGQPPGQTCVPGVNRAQVLFKETGGGALFSFAIPCDAPGTPYSFTGVLPPGRYDVSILGENSSLPQSTHVVQTGLMIDRDTHGLAYDLVTRRVSGVVTLNGAVPGQDATCRVRRGLVRLSSISATGGETIGLAIPCAPAGTPFTFSGEVYPGSYGVDVTGNGSELPRDRFRPAEPLVVSGVVDGLAIDVQTFVVAGAVTIDGAVPPPCTGTTWAQLNAEDHAKGYNFSISVPCEAADGLRFAAVLYPGQYTVWATINGGAPVVVADALTIGAPATGLLLDATTQQHTLSGTVTQNGAIPPSTCTAADARAVVVLDELVRGTTVTLTVPCGTPGSPLAFTGPVPAGTYRVTINGRVSQIPANGYVVATPLVVTGPASGLSFDVQTRLVAGTVTLDGAALPCPTSPVAANVVYMDESSGVTFAMPARCDAGSQTVRFAGELFPGTYTVVVFGVASAIPPTGFRGLTGLVVR